MLSTEKILSIAPDAPSRWPVAPFVLLMLTCAEDSLPWSGDSMRAFIALFSALSPNIVDVAWAFM